MPLRPSLACAAGALATLAAGAALAQPAVSRVVVRPAFASPPGMEVGSAVVRATDLDLSTDRGGAALLARIDAAAEAACKPDWITSEQVRADYEQCVAQSTDRAVKALGAPTVEYAYKRRRAPR